MLLIISDLIFVFENVPPDKFLILFVNCLLPDFTYLQIEIFTGTKLIIPIYIYRKYVDMFNPNYVLLRCSPLNLKHDVSLNVKRRVC